MIPSKYITTRKKIERVRVVCPADKATEVLNAIQDDPRRWRIPYLGNYYRKGQTAFRFDPRRLFICEREIT